jgi:hypothetical protein
MRSLAVGEHPQGYLKAMRTTTRGAYAHVATAEGGERGAVRVRGEMIDEAGRNRAEVIAGKGRAAGMSCSPSPVDV